MHVSVAICTWNRADLLEQTLQQFTQLNIPPNVTWELIVVNNLCTDHTEDVLNQFNDRLPLQVLKEEKQGHSHARNCAIAAANGELILWTDDDVLVDPNWLKYYVDAFQRSPNYEFAGGNIEPWFATQPPRWITSHMNSLQGAFAVIRRDENMRPLEADESIFGANMAFRTALLKEFAFDPLLGIVKDQPMRGDETELVARIIQSGRRGLWVGKAKVRHFIPKQRMNKKYLRRFFFGYGQAQTRLQGDLNVAMMFGKPRWAVIEYLKSNIASKCLLPTKNGLWLHYFKRAAICAGVIHESEIRKNKVSG